MEFDDRDTSFFKLQYDGVISFPECLLYGYDVGID
nr:hypothetical protein [Chlamydiota bacterium]